MKKDISITISLSIIFCFLTVFFTGYSAAFPLPETFMVKFPWLVSTFLLAYSFIAVLIASIIPALLFTKFYSSSTKHSYFIGIPAAIMAAWQLTPFMSSWHNFPITYFTLPLMCIIGVPIVLKIINKLMPLTSKGIGPRLRRGPML